MAKVLIVNADDFNSDAARSEGILFAGREGIVSSTSVLCNFPLSISDADQLREVFGNAVGIHLNITSGRPLLEGTKTLVSQKGCFYKKHAAWRRAIVGAFDLQEVEEEFAAQIEVLLSVGIMPSHFDSNNHLHVFPGFPGVLCRLAKRFNIERVRIPSEEGIHPKVLFLRALSRRARLVFEREKVKSPRCFAGIQNPDCSNFQSFKKFCESLPEGVSELMCHPGFCGNKKERAFSTVARERELKGLCDVRLQEVLALQGIEMSGFHAL